MGFCAAQAERKQIQRRDRIFAFGQYPTAEEVKIFVSW